MSAPKSNECVHEIIKLISKGFQSISAGHTYAYKRQLFSSLFLPAMRIKRTMLKIAVIENFSSLCR